MNKVLMWVLIGIGILCVLGLSVAAYIVVVENLDNGPGDRFVVKKPAIYLYPEKNMFVDVKLNVNGDIIEDIPKYNDGWHVFSTTDSLIEDKYDYLFYEVDLSNLNLPNEGWIVNYEYLNLWFEEKLPELGLNEKEKNQFKEYWLERLPDSEYYEIKLLTDEFLKENVDLIIEPKPDTVIRLNFHFKPLKEIKSITEPKIITPQRTGFTVVEWGGILSK